MKVNSTSRCNICISQLSNVLKTATGKTVVVFFMALLSFQSLKANDIYAISGGNLIAFKAANPGTITFSVPLTGVVSGQVIEGLDFRPATGELFAIGYVAASGLTQVYSINYKTGVATAIGAPVTLAANMVRVGMDFNPMVDRIRVTAFGGQNYRLNPNNGALVLQDGNLNYAAGDVHAGVNPRIEAVAYTNSFLGGTPGGTVTATTIYYYDYGFDDLANSSNPNGGVLNTVGNAGIVSLSGNGLDLDIITNPVTGIQCGYLTANTSGSTQTLYSINLATGRASSKGVIGANISEMAIFLALPTPELVYAITSTGSLVSFNSNNPSTFLKSSTLSGITAGQVVEGLDFRSATGELYALGYAAATGQTQVYVVDTVTGAATSVGAAVTLAANMTNVAMDFNPMADRIRVTSAQGNNYRLIPTTGAIVMPSPDGNLAYAPGDIRAGNTPAIAAVAYTNSFPGTTTTTIYYYDLALNSLALSTNPNAGVLNTVGLSGLMPANATGVDMDISSNPGIVPNTAFISTGNMLYSLNLTNGNARMLGTIGSSGTITDFAVYIAPPTPSRTVYALSGGSLIKFNTTTPGTVTTVGTLSGILTGQTVEGLDFRPATLDLYAVGYNATDGSTRIYIVDTTTAIATPVGSTNIMLAAGLSRLGVDFNPMADRIRVTSANGLNYRLNQLTGGLAATDSTLRYAAGDASVTTMPSVPNVNAVGYTNSMNAAMTTRLYYYDYMLDILATTSMPNEGVVNTVGRSGIITSTGNGLDMDIVRTPSNGTNTGFLSATVSGTTSNFYTINLATGEARLIGAIGAPAGITEMAIRLAGLDGSRVAPLVTLTGKKEGINSQLSWTTETEVNNSHFILERSADGTRFTAISGTINSAATDGNSNTALNYTYKDLSPVKGMNYYRLVQTDMSGKTTYSKAVQLQFNGGYEITMYPNPISSVINVNGFIAEKADLQIKVTDMNGRVMDVTSLKNQTGNWNARLNASNLKRGLYYVTVTKGMTVIHTETVQKN